MISFFVEDISFKIGEKQKLKNWIKEICVLNQKKVGEINYIFCSDEYLLNVNKEYLAHDFYTDIITFDQSDNFALIEGEIYISIDRIKENAAHLGVAFDEELRRVIIHGILHLVGYGDKTKEQSEIMRAMENESLIKYI